MCDEGVLRRKSMASAEGGMVFVLRGQDDRERARATYFNVLFEPTAIRYGLGWSLKTSAHHAWNGPIYTPVYSLSTVFAESQVVVEEAWLVYTFIEPNSISLSEIQCCYETSGRKSGRRCTCVSPLITSHTLFSFSLWYYNKKPMRTRSMIIQSATVIFACKYVK